MLIHAGVEALPIENYVARLFLAGALYVVALQALNAMLHLNETALTLTKRLMLGK